MMDEHQVTPEERAMIDRIQATPKLKIDDAIRAEIRQRMITEFRALPASGQGGQPTSGFISSHLFVYAGITILVISVIIIVAWVFLQNNNSSVEPVTSTPTILESATGTTVAPSATSSATSEAQSPTPTMTDIPTETPTTSPSLIPLSATPTPAEIILIIEGPITSITGNVLTIYDLMIEVEPQNPILSLIDVGDIVRVEGIAGEANTVVASTVSNLSQAPVAGATVGLEGPVEAIDGNVITVNGIPVQLAPDNPLLQTIQIGNFVSVQGNFESSGTIIVLVVVNITIINNIQIEGDPACWYHDDGMGMGHWHCDGMGMGMGMGDAMGMGGG